jgi:cardiolipin synthase
VLTLYPEMDCLLASLAKAVDEAKERVWIQTYIWRADNLGHAFGQKLVEAAARGVDVKLLYDALGCQATPGDFFEDLRKAGVDARPYRPFDLALKHGKWWPRDHSRVIVVDDEAWTGGAAWGDEWLPRKLGGLGWHDVCSSARGPMVDAFADVFTRRWMEANASAHPRAVRARFPDVELVADSPAHKSSVYQEHRKRIRSAKRRIWIENAYFLPPRRLLRDLFAAVRRGVDVKVILPGESDLRGIDRAAHAEFSSWLRGGLKLYRYAPAMTHAKFAVIDDWATVGTFNMNPTSVKWANECNLFFYDRAFVAEVAALYHRDLALSEPITREHVRERPTLARVQDILSNLVLRYIEGDRPSEAPKRWQVTSSS